MARVMEGRHASERKSEMSKRNKKDEKKTNETHGASDRDAMLRRERIAMRKAEKRVTDRSKNRTPKYIQNYIVTLRHADGTIIVKDTFANIEDWLYDLPNGAYHYDNDNTDSTHFFSVHDGGVDFIGAKMADGTWLLPLGGLD